jgi:hypothetical protein
MPNDPPWSCIPLADRLSLIYLEAGMRKFPRWMLGTLYEALESLRRKPTLESR